MASSLGGISDVEGGPEFCREGTAPGEAPKLLTAQYKCFEATILCDNTDPISVNLRVTEPSSSSETKGTIVFGTGGTGTSWYEASGASSVALLNRLNDNGYRVIQRAWGGEGWPGGSASPINSACRYSTLIDWIHGDPALHYPPQQAFCAAGNSAGSVEIGYALSTYGMEDKLDLALMTSGPPWGSLHRGCGVNMERRRGTCNDIFDVHLGICAIEYGDHNCLYKDSGLSNPIDPAFDWTKETPCTDRHGSVLRANSVLHSSADLDHPETSVQFLLGSKDCDAAVALAYGYMRNVWKTSSGPADYEVVEGGTHNLPETAEGAAAIESVILGPLGCRKHPRH